MFLLPSARESNPMNSKSKVDDGCENSGAGVSPAPLKTPMRPITIVGGGLAGLSLGIGLRQQSVPVVVWEMGHYPRHRVCGEFISGRGQETLQRLDLLGLLTESGARRGETAAFFSRHKRFSTRVLPQPALCLSRFELDALLAKRFQELGGELRCGARGPGTEAGEGIVRASGRRVRTDTDGWRWFGVKAHAKNVALTADLEMHLSVNGYVGLCRLQHSKTNVCGLFRRKKGDPDSAHSVVERLRGEPGSILDDRLKGAEFDETSVCAVAGLTLSPRRGASSNECCVGDALTMISPVTGNGMSMALESAELALPVLAAYARGEIEWDAARRAVGASCDSAFAWRLWWASRIQIALLCLPVQTYLLPFALQWEDCWRAFFWATR